MPCGLDHSLHVREGRRGGTGHHHAHGHDHHVVHHGRCGHLSPLSKHVILRGITLQGNRSSHKQIINSKQSGRSTPAQRHRCRAGSSSPLSDEVVWVPRPKLEKGSGRSESLTGHYLPSFISKRDSQISCCRISTTRPRRRSNCPKPSTVS